MTDTVKLKEAIDFYRGMNCETTEPMQTVLAAAKLVLAAQIAESAVEAALSALRRRCNGGNYEKQSLTLTIPVGEAIREMLTAASLSGTVERGVTEALEPGQLRLCPFCGGKAARVDFDGGDESDPNAGGSLIECTQCQASSPVHFDRKENLFSSWNDRVFGD